MRHSGLVSLALLILSLWTDLGLGLPRSQATFARDMRGDVMYNVADTGNTRHPQGLGRIIRRQEFASDFGYFLKSNTSPRSWFGILKV